MTTEEDPQTYHTSPNNTCLNCGEVVDAATGVSRTTEPPKKGDVSICMYCGHLAAFDGEGRVRELTDKEAHAIAGDPRIVRAVNALRIRRKQ